MFPILATLILVILNFTIFYFLYVCNILYVYINV